MWGKKKQVEEPVEVDEVFDDLHAELDDIVEAAEQPEAEVPEDFEARVNELELLLREAQERARQAKAAVKPEGLSPFKTPFESKPASDVERPRSLNRRITRVEVEAGESRIVSQFEDNEPEDKKVYPAVWNLGYRLEELAAAVAGILVDPDTGEIAHEHEEYAAADHEHDPQDLTHDHNDEYFAKGGASDDDGNPLPLPYSDAYVLGTAFDGHDHEHDHDEDYASKGELSEVKGDIESLEAELELLAKTLETGEWKVIDTPAPRPGEMWVAFDQFNVQQNQIVINNEDISGKSHGWSTVHEGDYVELIDKSDQQSRSIEHDYALYLVTSVEIGNGTVTIDVDLYQGQGDCLPDEVFEVRVLDIGDSDLDLDGLDARYVKKSGETEITGTRWSLTKKNNSGTSYIMQQFDGMDHMLYQLPDPTTNLQAANKRYVDSEINTHGHQSIPWNSKSGIPAWSRKVWSASSPGSSAFTPYTARGDGYTTSGSGNLVKDTVSIKFYYPEVHRYDFSGNGCLVFSASPDSMDRIIAVFQILWVSSSSSNSYTNIRCCYIWGNYTDTMKWKFNATDGANFNSTECRWGYMMVTGGGYWGPR